MRWNEMKQTLPNKVLSVVEITKGQMQVLKIMDNPCKLWFRLSKPSDWLVNAWFHSFLIFQYNYPIRHSWQHFFRNICIHHFPSIALQDDYKKMPRQVFHSWPHQSVVYTNEAKSTLTSRQRLHSLESVVLIYLLICHERIDSEFIDSPNAYHSTINDDDDLDSLINRRWCKRKDTKGQGH